MTSIAGRKEAIFILLAATSTSVPCTAHAEVLDKFPSMTELWLITGGAILLGLLLAHFSRWTMLLSWPFCTWALSFGLLQEFYQLALFQEGGWWVAANWHLMAIVSGTWPLIPLAQQRKSAMPSSSGHSLSQLL